MLSHTKRAVVICTVSALLFVALVGTVFNLDTEATMANVEIRIEISKIYVEDDMEGFLDQDPELYLKGWYHSDGLKEFPNSPMPPSGGWQCKKDEETKIIDNNIMKGNWSFEVDKYYALIVLELWDSDPITSDEQADISPASDNRTLSILYDTILDIWQPVPLNDWYNGSQFHWVSGIEDNPDTDEDDCKILISITDDFDYNALGAPRNVRSSADCSDGLALTFSWAEPLVTEGQLDILGYQWKIDGEEWTFTDTESVQTDVTDTGSHTFYVRAVDDGYFAGETASADFSVDREGPALPYPSAPGGWIASTSVSIGWNTPNDPGCGAVDGYSYGVDIEPNNSIDTAKNQVSVPVDADGVFTFKIKAVDTLGNWGNVGTTTFKVDLNAPEAPVPDDDVEGWNATLPTFRWTKPSKGSGSDIVGYSWAVDEDPDDTVDISDPDQTSLILSSVEDGEHIFKIRARDGAGHWGDVGTHKFKVDLNAPVAPDPDDDVEGWSGDNSPVLSWKAVNGNGSKILGYSYAFDEEPDEEVDANDTSAMLKDIDDGVHIFKVKAVDEALNWGGTGEHEFRIDTTPPSKTPALTVTPKDWVDENSFEIDWVDPEEEGATSGIAEGAYYYIARKPPASPEEATWTDKKPFVVANAPEGTNTIYVWLKDRAGNAEPKNYANGTLWLDPSKPYGLDIKINNDAKVTFQTKGAVLTLSAEDDISGVAEMCFRNEEDPSFGQWMPFDTSVKWSLSDGDVGKRTVYFKVRDKANNVAGPASDSIDLKDPSVNDVGDDQYPSITIDEPSNGEEVDSLPLTVEWSSTDGSSIVFYETKLDEGEWEGLGTVTEYEIGELDDGPHRLMVRATNEKGLRNTAVVYFVFGEDIDDTTPPTLAIDYPRSSLVKGPTDLVVKWSGEDGSGMGHYEIKLNDGPYIYKGSDTRHIFNELPLGSHSIIVRGFDEFGNEREVGRTLQVKRESGTSTEASGESDYSRYLIPGVIGIVLLIILIVLILLVILRKRRASDKDEEKLDKVRIVSPGGGEIEDEIVEEGKKETENEKKGSLPPRPPRSLMPPRPPRRPGALPPHEAKDAESKKGLPVLSSLFEGMDKGSGSEKGEENDRAKDEEGDKGPEVEKEERNTEGGGSTDRLSLPSNAGGGADDPKDAEGDEAKGGSGGGEEVRADPRTMARSLPYQPVFLRIPLGKKWNFATRDYTLA